MITPLRVLVVEDSEHDASLMLEALRWDQYEPESERVQTASAMRAALAAKEWDIILCDYSMPGFDAIAALRLLRESGLEVPAMGLGSGPSYVGKFRSDRIVADIRVEGMERFGLVVHAPSDDGRVYP